MAPRLIAVAVAALIAALAVGCASLEQSTGRDPATRLPTPLPSLTATLEATAGLLRGSLAEAGLRLDAPTGPVRPSEPASLARAPRAVLRASLADPGDGFIVVYDLADPTEARLRADELAAYLGSGFGQTNFAPDTQFSVAVVADTVVLSWWSRSRASDQAKAEAAFEAVRRVGEPVEVRK
jgi:hypothetical protein